MMKMFPKALALLFLATAAQAQQFDLSGQWACTVDARSNDPAGNYGLEAYMQVGPSGTLSAQGNVIFPGTMSPVQPFRGQGDWTILPAEPGQPSQLVKFRAHTQSHGIITWFARPVGPGRMYNLFQGTAQGGVSVRVETQCGKTG
ncbi:hypothetical protein [Pseudooceanicola sp.]|uniref:hypothetical protein n=1 Tax=Pseudooceanicola sp. TaxID=1914328 RepID=UPI004059D14D